VTVDDTTETTEVLEVVAAPLDDGMPESDVSIDIGSTELVDGILEELAGTASTTEVEDTELVKATDDTGVVVGTGVEVDAGVETDTGDEMDTGVGTTDREIASAELGFVLVTV
jgi:hypothetical protein